MRRGLCVTVVTAVVALVWVPSGGTATADGAPPPPHFGAKRPVGGSGAAMGDFDGDGFGDLAIGIPGEDLGSVQDAGAVQVMYGSAAGLAFAGNQLFVQSDFGLGTAETGDRFGASLAAGDFDGDGQSDLAIGVPGEDVGTTVDAGEVQVIFGSPNGLVLGGTQTFEGDEVNDRYGAVLAWANFGKGSQGDLAIGTPEEDVDGVFDAGEVQIRYGSPNGLKAVPQVLHQGGNGFGPAEQLDRFGASLAAGDVGRSGQADLAIGTPTEDVDDLVDAGLVQVVYGSSDGITTANLTRLTDLSPETGDLFGFALTTGNFDGQLKSDLAIGIPREEIILQDHGAVGIALGAGSGVGTVTRLIADLGAPGDGVQTGDEFGRSLASADFDRDGLADLAVGVPFEDFESDDEDPNPDTGTVLVFRGRPDGRPVEVAALFDVFKNSVDKFGTSLTAWDFGNGGAPDLAIGNPFDNPFNLAGKTTNDAGSVSVFYSSGNPTALFDPLQRDLLIQDSPGIPDVGEPGDQFGSAVY